MATTLVPSLKTLSHGENSAEGIAAEGTGIRPTGLPLRKLVDRPQTTARRNPSVTPHATQFFKTTVLPDGRAITSFHVAGVDGEPGRHGSFSDQPSPASMGSTQRLDFTERVYNRPEDRGNTQRYGNSSESWVTTKLVHREIGILPNAKGKSDKFYRDRFPRPQTTPAALTIWGDRSMTPLTGTSPSPPPIASPTSPSPAALPNASAAKPIATTKPSATSAAPDFETDTRSILASNADVTAVVGTWMQQASLFEREVAKRFLRDIAKQCARN